MWQEKQLERRDNVGFITDEYVYGVKGGLVDWSSGFMYQSSGKFKQHKGRILQSVGEKSGV